MDSSRMILWKTLLSQEIFWQRTHQQTLTWLYLQKLDMTPMPSTALSWVFMFFANHKCKQSHLNSSQSHQQLFFTEKPAHIGSATANQISPQVTSMALQMAIFNGLSCLLHINQNWIWSCPVPFKTIHHPKPNICLHSSPMHFSWTLDCISPSIHEHCGKFTLFSLCTTFSNPSKAWGRKTNLHRQAYHKLQTSKLKVGSIWIVTLKFPSSASNTQN